MYKQKKIEKTWIIFRYIAKKITLINLIDFQKIEKIKWQISKKIMESGEILQVNGAI